MSLSTRLEARGLGGLILLCDSTLGWVVVSDILFGVFGCIRDIFEHIFEHL